MPTSPTTRKTGATYFIRDGAFNTAIENIPDDSVIQGQGIESGDLARTTPVILDTRDTGLSIAYEDVAFRDFKIEVSGNLYGGGVVGAFSDAFFSFSSVGDISSSLFTHNNVTTTRSINGGGVVGIDTNFSSVGDISNSLFTHNTIKATGGAIWGGLIYTSSDLTLINSTFTDNILTAGGTYHGTVSIDTSKTGTGTHTVTLVAEDGKATTFQNIFTDSAQTNSLAFANIQDSSTSAANAVLKIDTKTTGTVVLHDPIRVDLNNGKTFTMTATGAGDFLWGGENRISADGGASFTLSGNTTLLSGFTLNAPGSTLTIRSGSTLRVNKENAIIGNLNASGANLDFYLFSAVAANDTLLSVSGNANISGATVNVGIEGNASPLKRATRSFSFTPER
jgi:hypothetical protein